MLGGVGGDDIVGKVDVAAIDEDLAAEPPAKVPKKARPADADKWHRYYIGDSGAYL